METKGISQSLCYTWFVQALFELAPDKGCRRVQFIDFLAWFAEDNADVVQNENADVFRKSQWPAAHVFDYPCIEMVSSLDNAPSQEDLPHSRT